MQKVITINLNGRAYQLDESAYESLRAYLAMADHQLKDNPDRVEILADFEQAIAEKCGRFLGPSKTVVTQAEMDQILKEMGPVEGAEPAAAGASPDTGPGAEPSAAPRPSRRLYRIREGQMISGVCNGIAAYFNVDPTFVRILFLIAAWTGVGILAYFALYFIVPYADTAEERAAAHGETPFNAQEIIDQAKKAAAEFKTEFRSTADATSKEWKRHWHAQRRQWRAQHRAWRRQWRERVGDPRAWGPWGPVPPAAYVPPAWAGYVLPVFSIISVAFFVMLAASIVSLLNTGTIYGWPLPVGIPLWGGILILVVLFQMATAPIRAARQASYYPWGRPFGWLAVWDSMLGLGFTILAIWLLYTHMPPPADLGDFFRHLPDAIRSIAIELRDWLRMFVEQFR
jgi:phage shock protein PspC (stress-responsive transcriptional regulator)